MATFSELLKSTTAALTLSTSDRLAEAVSRLSAQLDSAQVDADNARTAHESSLVDHALDSSAVDDKTLAKLKTAADGCRDRVASLEGALTTARARLSAAQAANDREEHRERWRAAIAVSAMKLDAEKRLAKSAKAFAEDYRHVLALNGEFYQAAPAIPDPEAAMAHATIIETAVRKELLRHGVPWAFSWPYGTVSLPEFLPQCEAAHELVKRWAPKD